MTAIILKIVLTSLTNECTIDLSLTLTIYVLKITSFMVRFLGYVYYGFIEQNEILFARKLQNIFWFY